MTKSFDLIDVFWKYLLRPIVYWVLNRLLKDNHGNIKEEVFEKIMEKFTQNKNAIIIFDHLNSLLRGENGDIEKILRKMCNIKTIKTVLVFEERNVIMPPLSYFEALQLMAIRNPNLFKKRGFSFITENIEEITIIARNSEKVHKFKFLNREGHLKVEDTGTPQEVILNFWHSFLKIYCETGGYPGPLITYPNYHKNIYLKLAKFANKQQMELFSEILLWSKYYSFLCDLNIQFQEITRKLFDEPFYEKTFFSWVPFQVWDNSMNHLLGLLNHQGLVPPFIIDDLIARIQDQFEKVRQQWIKDKSESDSPARLLRKAFAFKIANNHAKACKIFHQLGNLFVEKDNPVFSLVFYLQSIKLLSQNLTDENPEITCELAKAYRSMAAAHNKLGNNSEAIKDHNKAISIIENYTPWQNVPKYAYELARVYYSMAAAYRELGNSSEAIKDHCDKAINTIENFTPWENVPKYAYALATVYSFKSHLLELQGNFEEAKICSIRARLIYPYLP